MNDLSLNNKRILLFAPDFFGYEIIIKAKMEEMGAIVDFYNERAVRSSYLKALLKIDPLLLKPVSDRYYKRIKKSISSQHYNFVIFIKCEMISLSLLSEYRELFRESCFVLYLYDSLDNIKGIKHKLRYFDRILSFDRYDVQNNKNILFRPLFFNDNYRNKTRNDESKCDFLYDVSFIGTIHSDRYKMIQSLKSQSAANHIKCFFYCYLQNKAIYYFYKLTKREFRAAGLKDFQFEKISPQTASEALSRSKSVVDVQHPKQIGLTMRTIEMLGLGKKLITTNLDVVNYDFYSPLNCCIVNRNRFEIPDGFWETPYQEVASDVYERYSISRWIYDLLFSDLDSISFIKEERKSI